MVETDQFEGQSILDHGIDVYLRFKDLYNHKVKNSPLKYQWKLPDWINESIIWDNLAPFSDIAIYTIFHDIGKPDCLSIDSTGRRHFPNHANVSADVYSKISQNVTVIDLIRSDMDIHVLKADDVATFCHNPNWSTLLLVALCEIHSNADNLGGLETEAFKIKWKRLNQRGKAIIKEIKK